MLSTDRDSKSGSEHLAIPTQGEIEGKLLVYEVIAVACLQQLMREKHASVISKVRRLVLHNLEENCRSLKLCADDHKATAEYAMGLLDAALEKARAT
jgi:hypothetical protein